MKMKYQRKKIYGSFNILKCITLKNNNNIFKSFSFFIHIHVL